MEIYTTKGVQFHNGQPKPLGAQNRTPGIMRTTDPRHMKPASTSHPNQEVGKGFFEYLQNALQGVEKLDRNAKNLTTRAVYEPGTVEVHNVLIAAEKTRFALNFTKAIANGIVRSFKELTSPR